MHRISCFGSVAGSTTVTHKFHFECTRRGQHAFTPYDVNVTFVQGVTGPRLEIQRKKNTITGWPGGLVNGVDHLYMDGICYPKESSGFEPVFNYSSNLVVPVSDCEFANYDYLGPAPSLARGQSVSRLMSVTKYQDTPKNPKVTRVEARVLVRNRTLEPFADQIMDWLFVFELPCFVDANGEYLIEKSTQMTARPPVRLAPPPPMPPYLWMVTGGCSYMWSHIATNWTLAIPYASSLQDYWKEEQKGLNMCKLDPYRRRDATFEALESVLFTEALSLENLKDLLDVMETFKGFLSVVKDFRKAIKKMNPLLLLKVVASVHLIYRYVIKTTTKDLKDLKEFAEQLWLHRDDWWGYLSIARGRCKAQTYDKFVSTGQTYSCTMNLRLDIRPAQYQMITYLRTVGLGLTPAMFWDMVPFSFVVDWVLPVGDTIEAVSTLYDLQNLDKLFVTSLLSHRHMNHEIYPGVLLYGKSQRFLRVVSREYQGATTPPGFRIKNPIKNFWTAVALVISLIKSGGKG